MSTCATAGAGNGATPPGSKPVAARTSAGFATRAAFAPATAATFVSSARRSPGTSASVGRPSQMKRSDLTIWPSDAPTAFAAARAVGVPSRNSSTRASMPASRRTAATRSTGSGQRSAGHSSITRASSKPSPRSRSTSSGGGGESTVSAMSALPPRGAARDGHAGDVDPGLAEQRPDAADHAGHVVVAAEDEERRELQLDLEAEDVDEPRPVVAADRRPGDAPARAAGAHLDAEEARVVAGGARAFLPHLHPALGGDRRRVDEVDRTVGAAAEGAVERRDAEQARVVVGERAVRRDDDLLRRAVGELHRDAAELRRERHVRAERLGVLGADDGRCSRRS